MDWTWRGETRGEETGQGASATVQVKDARALDFPRGAVVKNLPAAGGSLRPATRAQCSQRINK